MNQYLSQEEAVTNKVNVCQEPKWKGLLLAIGCGLSTILFIALYSALFYLLKEKGAISISESSIDIITSGLGFISAAGLSILLVRNKLSLHRISEQSINKINIFHAILLSVGMVAFCHVILDFIMATLFSGAFPIEKAPVSAEANVWLSALDMVIIAPIFEELIYRYVIFTVLKRSFSAPVSMAICSLIFALSHMYSLPGLISTFVASMLLCIIYHRTGKLWYGIVAHATCNLFTIIMNILEVNNVKLFGQSVQHEINGYNTFHYLIVIGAVLLLIVTSILLYKNRKRY